MSALGLVASINLCLAVATAALGGLALVSARSRRTLSGSTWVGLLRFALLSSFLVPLCICAGSRLTGVELTSVALAVTLDRVDMATTAFAGLVLAGAGLAGLGLFRDLVLLRRTLARSARGRRLGKLEIRYAPAGSPPFALATPTGALVVMPSGTTAESRRLILRHELTHLRHADPAWNWVAAAAALLCAWNPLFRVWRHWHAHACEQACDRAVLSRPGVDAEAYLATLLDLAGAASPGPRASAPVAAFLGGARLRKRSFFARVAAIVEPPAESAGRSLAVSCAAALLLLSALASSVEIDLRSWSVRALHQETLVNLALNRPADRVRAFGLVMAY